MKNSTKMPDPKKLSKELGAKIRNERNEYEKLRVHGGQDPFWSDGVNMNLCRNHVIYLRKRIENELDESVRNDDLIEMRRCQSLEYYVKYLRDSRKKLDEILDLEVLEPKLHEGQLTIWDYIGG